MLQVLVFLLVLNVVDSSKFLVYNPRLGHSQTIFMGEISDILAKAGHDVLNYAPIVINSCNTTGSSIARTLIRQPTHKTTYELDDIKSSSWLFDHRSYRGAIEMFSSLGKEFELSCREQLNDEGLLKKLRDENFDLGLTEYFDICGLALFHKIGLKRWILLYSTPMPLADMSIFGLDATPSFTPSLTVGWSTERMTLIERFFNLFNYFLYKHYIRNNFIGQTAEAFPPNMPHYLELMAQSAYVFVNVDEYLDFPRPISHKMINIGGVGMHKMESSNRTLDPRIQNAFDTAKKGVVLVSFGSVASSYGAPNHIKQAFLKAFEAFPDITFLWKYEKPQDKIADGHKNVITSEWLDQTRILTHPRLLAFITHGGLNSVTQASYAGAPMICIPLFADQTRNGALIESRELGVRLDKFKLDAQTLIDAIREVVYNEKYLKKAKELSKLIKAKPMSPDERIVKYSEHAAQFDIDPYLNLYGRQLSTITYYNLDIVFLLLLFVSSVVFVFYRLLLLAFQRAPKRKTQ